MLCDVAAALIILGGLSLYLTAAYNSNPLLWCWPRQSVAQQSDVGLVIARHDLMTAEYSFWLGWGEWRLSIRCWKHALLWCISASLSVQYYMSWSLCVVRGRCGDYRSKHKILASVDSFHSLGALLFRIYATRGIKLSLRYEGHFYESALSLKALLSNYGSLLYSMVYCNTSFANVFIVLKGVFFKKKYIYVY